LAELFKILSDGEDNSLRITHHALRITITVNRLTDYTKKRKNSNSAKEG